MSSPCSGNLPIERDTAMKKIAAILALALTLTIGMTLTTAFAFSLLPLVLA